jgi:sulfatase modifying factor 1
MKHILALVAKPGLGLTVLAILALLFALATVKLDASSGPEDTAAEDGMVLIPAGTFTMGSEDAADTKPTHEVFLNSFYIDKYEVTNAQYQKFFEETGRIAPEFWGMDRYSSGPDSPDCPVMGISWTEAKAYAEWCGKRLPTEAEWEYAARGGLSGEKYANGGSLDSTVCNYWESSGPRPVGGYAPNGYGLYDMQGNVAEWCSDIYGYDFYSASPDSNPTGPEKGKFRVIRGGGWHTGPSCTTVAFRNGLRSNWKDFGVGIRCAKDYP